MGRTYDVEVTRAWMLNGHVRGLRLRRADGEPLRARPGQFFMLHVDEGGETHTRSYSVADVPCEDGSAVELCVALLEGGLGSGRVRAAEPGTTWTLSGPHGRFVLRGSDPAHTVLVATGTGIAPFRSMRAQLRERLEAGERVDLIVGYRCEEDLLYEEAWAELAAEFATFAYHRCLSRPDDPKAHLARGGIVGRVQAVLSELDFAPDDSVFYVCGNPDMVADVKGLLAERGVGRRQVRTEAYVAAEPS